MEVKEWTYEAFRNYSEPVEGAFRIPTTGDEIMTEYIRDVIYDTPDNIPLTLQILRPYTRNEPVMPVPLFIFVQGSAWGEQNVYKNIGSLTHIAERRIAVAIVQYRHSGLAPFPAPIQDARNAVRYMKEHADDYAIDPEKIVLGGTSSGGHTAMFAGTMPVDDFFDPGPINSFSPEVRGIINLYGSISALEDDAFPTTLDCYLPTSPEGREMGGVNLYEHPELREKLSYITWVKPELQMPPVMIIHGTKDMVVNTTASVNLYKHMKAQGRDVSLYLIDSANHGGGEYWSPQMVDLMERFIRRCIE